MSPIFLPVEAYFPQGRGNPERGGPQNPVQTPDNPVQMPRAFFWRLDAGNAQTPRSNRKNLAETLLFPVGERWAEGAAFERVTVVVGLHTGVRRAEWVVLVHVRG